MVSCSMKTVLIVAFSGFITAVAAETGSSVESAERNNTEEVIVAADSERVDRAAIDAPKGEIIAEVGIDEDSRVVAKSDKVDRAVVENTNDIVVEVGGDDSRVVADSEKVDRAVVENKEEIVVEVGGDDSRAVADSEKVDRAVVHNEKEVVVEVGGDDSRAVADSEKVDREVVHNEKGEIVVEVGGDDSRMIAENEKVDRELVQHAEGEIVVELGGDNSRAVADPEKAAAKTADKEGATVAVIEHDGDDDAAVVVEGEVVTGAAVVTDEKAVVKAKGEVDTVAKLEATADNRVDQAIINNPNGEIVVEIDEDQRNVVEEKGSPAVNTRTPEEVAMSTSVKSGDDGATGLKADDHLRASTANSRIDENMPVNDEIPAKAGKTFVTDAEGAPAVSPEVDGESVFDFKLGVILVIVAAVLVKLSVWFYHAKIAPAPISPSRRRVHQEEHQGLLSSPSNSPSPNAKRFGKGAGDHSDSSPESGRKYYL